MKTTKNFILFCTVILLISCKGEVQKQTRILLKNDSGSEIEVTVFPKADYRYDNELYEYTSWETCHDVKYTLSSGYEEDLFTTENLSLSPTEIANMVFDSIYIKILGQNEIILKFRTDSVTNYSENLFSVSYIWEYIRNDYNEPTMFKKNPIESDDYYFKLIVTNIVN